MGSTARDVAKSFVKPSIGDVFPPLEDELAPVKHLLKGKVLNAGAGWRDISHLVDGELVNQDLKWGPDDNRTNIHIFSPLDKIAAPDNTFDAVLCNAVLEHVENPEDVMPELHRVTKPGGHLILTVPFMQPEHKCPTDFQRWTVDGLSRQARMVGFEVASAEPMFTVYHTLYWQCHVWLHLKNSLKYKAMRKLILPPLMYLSRRSKTQSPVLASAIRVIGRKAA